MEKLIEQEICKNCTFKEKVVVKIFRKTFIKTYHIGRINCINNRLKNSYTK